MPKNPAAGFPGPSNPNLLVSSAHKKVSLGAENVAQLTYLVSPCRPQKSKFGRAALPRARALRSRGPAHKKVSLGGREARGHDVTRPAPKQPQRASITSRSGLDSGRHRAAPEQALLAGVGSTRGAMWAHRVTFSRAQACTLLCKKSKVALFIQDGSQPSGASRACTRQHY